MNIKKIPTYDLCLISIFTAIIAIMSLLSIPMPYGVPMTLQTLAISLSGVVLGAKKGVVSTIAYILIGAIGVPVFSGFSGGIGAIFGYTGGFILSFPILALTAGIGGSTNKKHFLWIWLTVGTIINYLCGILYFDFVMGSGLKFAFTACVLPFIPTDIIKIIVVGLFGLKIRHILLKGK